MSRSQREYREWDDCMKLKLSEMFEVEIPLCEFEWTDTMLNINSDCNRELLE